MVEIRLTDKDDNCVYELEISGVTTSRQLSSAMSEALSQLYFRLGLNANQEAVDRDVRGVYMNARVEIQLPFSMSE
ncbi:MAG: hypothetical protein HQL06_15380 [Nitrospirae bacterium]|nr:hypothetical protein [Nitrospirota bacterium]